MFLSLLLRNEFRPLAVLYGNTCNTLPSVAWYVIKIIHDSCFFVSVQGFSIEEAMRILQVDQASVGPPHQGNYTSHNLTHMETLLHNVPQQPNVTMAIQSNMSMANQANMSMSNQANMSMANQANMSMANQANMPMIIQPNMTMAALPNMSVSTQLNMSMANQANMSMAAQFGMPMMTEPNMPLATQLGMMSVSFQSSLFNLRSRLSGDFA